MRLMRGVYKLQKVPYLSPEKLKETGKYVAKIIDAFNVPAHQQQSTTVRLKRKLNHKLELRGLKNNKLL